jgi:hypothetical protein
VQKISANVIWGKKYEKGREKMGIFKKRGRKWKEKEKGGSKRVE